MDAPTRARTIWQRSTLPVFEDGAAVRSRAQPCDSYSPVTADQTRTVWSELADTIFRPSGLNSALAVGCSAHAKGGGAGV
eukprot:SAG22_NODE_127_length_18798_cov_11.748757_3_plen_80_part_00